MRASLGEGKCCNQLRAEPGPLCRDDRIRRARLIRCAARSAAESGTAARNRFRSEFADRTRDQASTNCSRRRNVGVGSIGVRSLGVVQDWICELARSLADREHIGAARDVRLVPPKSSAQRSGEAPGRVATPLTVSGRGSAAGVRPSRKRASMWVGRTSHSRPGYLSAGVAVTGRQSVNRCAARRGKRSGDRPASPNADDVR